MVPGLAVPAQQGFVLLSPARQVQTEQSCLAPTRMWLFSCCKAEKAAAAVNDFFWAKYIYNTEVRVNCLLQPSLSNLTPVKVPGEHHSQSLKPALGFKGA